MNFACIPLLVVATFLITAIAPKDQPIFFNIDKANQEMKDCDI